MLFISQIICAPLLLVAGCAKNADPILVTTMSKIRSEEIIRDTIPVERGGVFFLEKDFDLMNKIFVIPEGATLVSKKGVFKNGTLVGRGTSIKGNKPLFDHVTIEGDWYVPEITTSLFVDLDYDNSLRDVFALASGKVKNRIIIGDGDFFVTAMAFNPALNLPSNTKLVMNCCVHLKPNDHAGCYVLNVKNAKNVEITGGGIIEGDRQLHKGKKGEWGHGINILSSTNVEVNNITIRNCWGDCIYVGDNSTKVKIVNCYLEGGRRQGISVTSGRNVDILGCNISNIYGTEPQYAIDVEPNKDEIVDDVRIERVKVSDCYGAFTSWGGAENCRIGKILINNCEIKGISCERPIRMSIGDKVKITKCRIETNQETGIFAEVIKDLTIRNNLIISSSKQNAIKVRRCKKSSIRYNNIK